MRSTRSGWGTAVLALLLIGSGLASGCSNDSTSIHTTAATGTVTAGEAQKLLDRRADAILHDKLSAFLATLDSSNARLISRQRRYFANMQALPVQTLEYTVLKSDWPAELRAKAWGTHASIPQVKISTQLAGFDSVPIARTTGFAFGRKGGKPVIISELTGAGKQFPGSSPSPWDLVRIHVYRSGQTLQLYDNGTWHEAGLINSALRRGIANVQDGLPFAWAGKVVVYVFSAKTVLDSYEGVPGGNIKHLGAMTFPMYAVLGQSAVAGVRFTLLPSSVRAGQPFLDRIVRHELTHVAVGDRDDGVPVWFAEGLAEYMGARSIPTDQRRIATVAVKRARQGVTALPASAGFNGPDQAWNYALAWMACDWIVATQGSARLWELMDALHDNGDGTTDEDQDAVLEQVLGISGSELAKDAAHRILEIYG
ncbi:hypothetical protein [Nocardioides marmorisolisilvae]|uniref:Peptidase MA-like domain-containing protein n=1 Tax=Nocardioides marmorisolisilvae TaxID=1542737 RepID=A0A3N0DVZ0_9ACTN|nr:hypothetical protein [Nocardioides marmorisolisilvae]RNL79583.1 hypothetical protein EFL95_11455 [Nocardioides marmorisolisilvae]